jgi:hypothetical protein
VYPPLLDELICTAEVVFIEHYYANSSLEVHRINPLLLAGKVVVSVPSGDMRLQVGVGG